jgi:hypothetical protein
MKDTIKDIPTVVPQTNEEIIDYVVKEMQNTLPINPGGARCTKKDMDTKKCHAFNGGECMNGIVCSPVNKIIDISEGMPLNIQEKQE